MLTIGLYLATNIAVLVMLSISMSVLGFEPYMQSQGVDLNLQSLLMIAGVFGVGGSLISLLMSKWSARTAMGVRVIDQPGDPIEDWLVQTVARQAERAGIGMPEVGIFDSSTPNAFATGANRNNALVAVSTGLLSSLRKEEVEAVMGHEISHVANGDMLRLALIQGVLNTFVIFFARVIGHLVDRVLLKNDRGHGVGFWVSTIAAEILLSLLARIIVMWFSRAREFRADAGGAELAGTGAMIGALQRLRMGSSQQPLPDQFEAFGIFGGVGTGIARLFLSHPPLEVRIAALERAQQQSR